MLGANFFSVRMLREQNLQIGVLQIGSARVAISLWKYRIPNFEKTLADTG
jgi:hypothetical protein